MPLCVYCSTPINESYNFCLECEKQVKCRECSSYLIKDKSKCFSCGTPLIAVQSSQSTMNTFTLVEHRTETSSSRKINLSFTNEAIDKAAPYLNGYTDIDRSSTKPKNSFDKPKLNFPINETEETLQDTTYSLEEEENKEGKEDVKELLKDELEVNNYFEKDSAGYLIVINPDFKGDSKKDQQQRFFILYIWAFNKILNAPVPSIEHIIAAAKVNSLHDTNFRRTFDGIAAGNIVQTDGKLKLSPNGNQFAVKILQQIDKQEMKGFDYSVPYKKGSGKGVRVNSELKLKLEEWVTKKPKFNDVDIRQVNSTVKLCLLPYYDLISDLKLESTVKAGDAYDYLLKKYKLIKISRKTFVNTVSDARNKKYFSKAPDGGYFITTEGENLIESVL